MKTYLLNILDTINSYEKHKRMFLIGGAVLLVGIILTISFFFGGITAGDIPTYKVKRGEFLITLIESGEIRAEKGDKIIAPRVHGTLKIIHLWPEGEKVDVGNLIVQFDQENYRKTMIDAEGELERRRPILPRPRRLRHSVHPNSSRKLRIRKLPFDWQRSTSRNCGTALV